MVNLIFYFYPWFLDAEESLKLNRCITSWKIIEVNVNNDYQDNCDLVNIITESNYRKYILESYSVPLELNPRVAAICSQRSNAYYLYWFWKSTWISYLPEIWDNVDFLVDKDSYKIISPNKISNWEYEIAFWNYTSTWNFQVCEPNLWEDTEIQAKFRSINTYLSELSYNKPRTAKKLLTTLENLNLSIFPQKTNTLVLYAREVLKMLVESL
jgi:hypothetical protein